MKKRLWILVIIICLLFGSFLTFSFVKKDNKAIEESKMLPMEISQESSNDIITWLNTGLLPS